MNILTEVMKMDLNELRSLKMVVDKFIENKVSGTIRELRIGDKVKVNHRKVAGLTFAVKKINRKKVKVQQADSHIVYSVSMNLIEKI